MPNLIRILGIAPYEELSNAVKNTSLEFENVELSLYTADLNDALDLLEELDLNNYDVILSRGGTADLIRESVKLPVIDISISIYDVLSAIQLGQNYTENFAIVGYSSITEPAHLLCDILGYKITILTLNEELDVASALKSIINDDYELILCDVITNQTALSKGVNTLLITSGVNSIRTAITQCLEIAKYLNEEKTKTDLLEALLFSTNEEYLIFNKYFEKIFSTVEENLEQAVLSILNSRVKNKQQNDEYFTFQNVTHHLTMTTFTSNNDTHYSCQISKSSKPTIDHNLDVNYLNPIEVEDHIKQERTSKFVLSDQINNLLIDLNKYNQSILISGDIGTGKTTVAFQSFLNQKKNKKNLITINSKQLDEKIWKFLVNSVNGPLVEEGNTIFLQNIEELSQYDFDKFITTVQNTRFLNRNNLILSFNSSNYGDMYSFNQILKQLRSGHIQVPSISDRKNELNIISTILLNRINIEYGKDIVGFEPEAFKTFLDYHWPGNFDQLEAVMRKLVLETNSHYISINTVAEALKDEDTLRRISTYGGLKTNSVDTYKNLTLFDYNQEIIRQIMEKNNYNQTKTASELGISRTTLWRYLKNDTP